MKLNGRVYGRWPRYRGFRLPWWLGALGPGLIAANAGNDAGGIATYASVGAAYGYDLIWMMILITFSLVVVQEMCARMGVVTGKGLTDLIRENFPLPWTAFAMLTILLVAAGTTVSEFAGIAASLELFHISRFVSVPLCALLAWLTVTKGDAPLVEKIFLSFTIAFFGYIVAAFMAAPDWSSVLQGAFVPKVRHDMQYIQLIVATVGTTIAPWMPMVLQSTVAERGIPVKDYRLQKIDVIIGAVFADIVAIFIIISTAQAIYVHMPHMRGPIDDAAQAALALQPFAGKFASALFAIGLFGASMLAAQILPLATAFAVCEAFGLERGVSKKVSEAPLFYALFTGLLIIGALGALIPGIPLFKLLIGVQALNGTLLPILLVFIMLLVNQREIMGHHVNGVVFNAIAWLTVAGVGALAVTYVTMLIFGS